MALQFKNYQGSDFIRVRDFLSATYQGPRSGANWKIERWNFAFSMARLMNQTTLQEMESQIGLWESEGGKIAAVVNSEGENQGEVFFQLGDQDYDNEDFEAMLNFAESRMLPRHQGNRRLQLRISEHHSELETFVQHRGYIQHQELVECTSGVNLSKWKHRDLPEGKGFQIVDGNQVSDREKGLAHAHAFGYWEKDILKFSPIAYEAMRQMPDYRPELDLYVTEPSGLIAAFCTLWYDAQNQIAILEPVGTHYSFRRMGLGHAVLSEGMKRVAAMGVKQVYVGSRQPFYLDLGFEIVHRAPIWEKTLG